MNYYLGIDSGGTVIKAGIFDENGKSIAIYKENTQVLNDKPGWVERNLAVYWQETCSVIKGVLKKSAILPNDIKGVSISAQGKGVYLLDKKGNDLRNGILSSDSRSIDIVKAWQQANLPDTIYPITKQTLWTGHPVSILRWLKEFEPENYANIGAVLMSHDYLRYRLTGDISAEITNISESNFFNNQTNDYDVDLLKLFGIEEIYPALVKHVQPTELVGVIQAIVAKQTGLVAGTPVFAGLFDVVSTAICSGIELDCHKLNVVMGTWAVTSGITAEILDEQQYHYVYGHYAIAGQYIIHEASPTSASNYEWFAPYLGENGELIHHKNEELVRAVEPVSTDLIFIPFLYGSNAGLGLKSGLYGLQAHHKKGQIIQAIWEGILFCHYVHIQRMLARFSDTQILRVTGGTTQSGTWMQMLADLTGLTVEVTNIEETGALGAALIAMVGDGQYLSISHALKRVNYEIKTFFPNAKYYQGYQEKYQRYLRFIELLKQFEDH